MAPLKVPAIRKSEWHSVIENQSGSGGEHPGFPASHNQFAPWNSLVQNSCQHVKKKKISSCAKSCLFSFIYGANHSSPSHPVGLGWTSALCCLGGTGRALLCDSVQNMHFGAVGMREEEKVCPAPGEQIFWPRTRPLGTTSMFLWYSFFLILAIPFSAALDLMIHTH